MGLAGLRGARHPQGLPSESCWFWGHKEVTVNALWWPQKKGCCPAWERASVAAGLPLPLQKNVFSWKIVKRQPRPLPVARCSEGGRPLCNGYSQRLDKQSPCEVQTGPHVSFSPSKWLCLPNDYSFLSLGLWEEEVKMSPGWQRGTARNECSAIWGLFYGDQSFWGCFFKVPILSRIDKGKNE